MNKKTAKKAKRPSLSVGELHHLNTCIWPEVFVLICKVEDNCCHVIPGSFWAEKAGPHDLILPKSILGDYAFLAMDMYMTLSADAIGAEFAKLSKNVFNAVKKASELLESGKELKDGPLFWGIPYLNDVELRCVYHQEFLSEMIAAQESLKVQIFDGDALSPEETAGNEKSCTANTFKQIDFTLFALQSATDIREDIAAADTGKSDTVQFKTINLKKKTHKDVIIRFVGRFKPFLPKKSVPEMSFSIDCKKLRINKKQEVRLYSRINDAVIGKGYIFPDSNLVIICKGAEISAVKKVDSLADLIVYLEN